MRAAPACKPARRRVLLAGLACLAWPALSPAAGGASDDEPPFASKLGLRKIWVNAKNGRMQDLLVELHAAEIESRIAKQRLAQQDPRRDRELVEQLQGELHAVKESVFPQGRLEDAQVVQDFSVLPVVLVRVPGLRALEAILKSPAVRLVSVNGEVKIAAIRP